MSFPVSPYEAMVNVWKAVHERFDSQLHEMLRDIVCKYENESVEGFCSAIFNSPASAVFLSPGRADVGLELHKWINSIFYASLDKNYSEAIIFQRGIGELFARLGVPLHVVMEGVRVILSRLYEILLLTSPAAGVDVFSCAVEVVN